MARESADAEDPETLLKDAVSRLAKLEATADKDAAALAQENHYVDVDPEDWMAKRDAMRWAAHALRAISVAVLLFVVGILVAEILRPIGKTYSTSFSGDVHQIIPYKVE